jgi:hypothetical protein
LENESGLWSQILCSEIRRSGYARACHSRSNPRGCSLNASIVTHRRSKTLMPGFGHGGGPGCGPGGLGMLPWARLGAFAPKPIGRCNLSSCDISLVGLSSAPSRF